ncbi:MAG TPA: hypothetical protein VH165_05225 [Kofleriaceae bacterium]|nr:hypothetical protein [Kofleriaceae bacterium]
MSDPLARLEQALARLGHEHEPPPGWEARVLAATRQPKRRRWWWTAGPLLALALVLIWIVFALQPDGATSGTLALSVTYDNAGTVVRGAAPHPGDRMCATATGGGEYRAVWIYRYNKLVEACPGTAQSQGPWCRAKHGATATGVMLLDGVYRVVALTASAPLARPPLSSKYDDDVSGARDLHAEIRTTSVMVQ